MQQRWVRFQDLGFGVIPVEFHAQCRRDLLAIESRLAARQSDIGLVADWPFDPRIDPDYYVQMRPTPVTTEQRQAVTQQIRDWLESDVIEAVPEVDVAVNVVLVEQAQSGQPYRICWNAVAPNTHTSSLKYPMQDMQRILEEQRECDCWSVLDLKSGFHNIPVVEEQRCKLGLVTHDGLFRFKRMVVGLKNSPAWFQFVVNRIILQAGVDAAAAFVDDLTVGGSVLQWQDLWKRTLRVMIAMADAGFMFNLRKCKFCTPRATVLGRELLKFGYRLSCKFLASWLGVAIPRNLQQLQSLLGKLLYCSPHIPNYKLLLGPLESLLQQRERAVWTPECTNALNRLLAWVFAHVRLHQPRAEGHFRVYPSTTDNVGSVVVVELLRSDECESRGLCGFVQAGGVGQVPVAFASRYLTATEQRSAAVVSLLSVVHWGMMRMRRFLSFATDIEVVLPTPECVVALRGVPDHLRLQALLVDVSTFNPRWTVGPNPWSDPTLDPTVALSDEQVEAQQCPSIEHEDVVLTMPRRAADKEWGGSRAVGYVVQFDGGAAQRQGTGGFLIWGLQGELVHAQAIWYGDSVATNNVAECSAMRDALCWLQQAGLERTRVLVLGDSQLTIDFVARRAKPKVQALALLVEELRRLRRAWGPGFEARHVPRERNCLADWLGNLARAVKQSVDATAMLQLDASLDMFSEPPWPAALGWAGFAKLSSSDEEAARQHLQGVAAHLSVQSCVVAAAAALLAGSEVVGVQCSQCGQAVLDIGEKALSAKRLHVCELCGKQASTKSPVHANPLAGLKPVVKGMGCEVMVQLNAPQAAEHVNMLRPAVARPSRYDEGQLGLSCRGTMERLAACEICKRCRPGLQCRECWGCRAVHHYVCVTAAQAEGPYYCAACRQVADDQGVRDITLDSVVMSQVVSGTVPDGLPAAEIARVQRAVKWLVWDGARLYANTHQVLRRIPALVERKELVEEAARSLGFPGGRRLRQVLSPRYYWTGLAADVLRWCKEFAPVQLTMKGGIKPPKYLLPTPRKATAPFHTWAIDLVTHLGNGSVARHLIVCVDVFSKWVEAGCIADKESSTVTTWFHANITCRFGTPAFVRADRGGEFRGDFERYLSRLGCRLLLTLPNNPRANGLVERINGLIVSGLRRVLVEVPEADWEAVLADVLAGLRFLPTRLGWQPFVLVFKQHPQCLLEASSILPPPTEADLDADDDEQSLEAYMQSTLGWWESAVVEARARLLARDDEMRQQYAARRDRAKEDLREQLQPGDYVMVAIRSPSKLEPRWDGPCMVLRLTGQNQAAVEILKPNGRTAVVAVANVRLWRGDVPGRKRERVESEFVQRKRGVFAEDRMSSSSDGSDDEL